MGQFKLMRPRATTYRLAYSAQDYHRCHQFLKDQGQEEEGSLSWPTVMAAREGALVGCLSTIPSKTAIIAGPLVVSTKRPLMTVMRLVDAYEYVLREASISAYHFGIDLTEHQDWLDLLLKLGRQPYHRDEQAAWFKRDLQERR